MTSSKADSVPDTMSESAFTQIYAKPHNYMCLRILTSDVQVLVQFQHIPIQVWDTRHGDPPSILPKVRDPVPITAW